MRKGLHRACRSLNPVLWRLPTGTMKDAKISPPHYTTYFLLCDTTQ